MTVDDLMIYFKYKQINIACALGLPRATVHYWMTTGYIPFGRQCEIELFTKGALKASKKHCKKDNRRRTYNE
jgi:hypothetical protein